MPNVNGKKFPYTPAGKEAAKKASAKMTAVTSMRKDKKQSKGFSGANSQMGPSY